MDIYFILTRSITSSPSNKLLSGLGFVDSINRAYLTERDEPVYGPEGEKKTVFFR